jgi:hypothetical protein
MTAESLHPNTDAASRNVHLQHVSEASPPPAGKPPLVSSLLRRSSAETTADRRKQPASPEKQAASRKRPTRTIVNFWLDTALLVVLLAQSTVAAITYLVFPVGTAAAGWSLWGMDYNQWCSLQFVLLCVLGFGVFVHVMLHWTWVCSVLLRNVLNYTELPDNGIRTLYGVGFLIVLLHIVGGIVLLAQFTVQQPQ